MNKIEENDYLFRYVAVNHLFTNPHRLKHTHTHTHTHTRWNNRLRGAVETSKNKLRMFMFVIIK